MKKILLISLILMASCFGILGMGGEGEAASCSDTFCMRGFPTACKTANQWCIRGGLRNPSCSPITECWFNAPFSCIEPQTLCLKNSAASYQWYCKSSLGTCDCDRLKQVAACDDQCCKDSNDDSYSCVNGKCQASETCISKRGECCDLNNNICRAIIPGVSSSCSGDNSYCCEKGKCYSECEAKKGQVCCDLSTNKCDDVVTSGPRYCSSGTCCQPGSCVPKTTAACNCQYGGWSDNGACGADGCSATQKPQIRTENPTAACVAGDCGNTSRCHNDASCSGAAPASVVPVIPQSTSIGGGGSSGTGPSTDPGASGGAVGFTNPLSTNSFEALVMGIINWILGIVVSLAILFLIIGGLMYIISAGDEEKIKKAKNIILYAIIGLGVVILSWSIITELKDILGVK